MRFDEVVVLSWRQDVNDAFEKVEVWSSIQDSGTASFDVGSGLSRADAYTVLMRYHSMPPTMRTLLYNVVQRVVLGDFTLAQCRVRGRDLLVTSITTLDEREREIEITCTSRQP